MDQIIIIDDLIEPTQFKNLIGKKFIKILSTVDDLSDIEYIDFVVHFGANANTLESNWSKIYKENVLSTRKYYELAQKKAAKFIFASSAAVYGNNNIPLNQYAFSKLLSETELKDAMILRLFNVYGCNEYHKNRMASTVFHWFNQLKNNGCLKLFDNSKDAFRDFIHVEDVAAIVCRCLDEFQPGIYDVGTTESINFETVSDKCLEIFGKGKKEYIEMPNDLVSQYQFFTKARSNILTSNHKFISIHDGIEKYFSQLKLDKRY